MNVIDCLLIVWISQTPMALMLWCEQCRDNEIIRAVRAR